MIFNTTVLEVKHGYIYVYGSPLLVNGIRGRLSMTLNGVDQYIDVGLQKDLCIGDTDLCHLGVTIAFTMKIHRIDEDGYVFTSCGDRSDSYGYAMYYKRNQLYVTISNSRRRWVAAWRADNIDHAADYLISWSQQNGLSVYVNRDQVAQSTDSFERRIDSPRECTFLLGRSDDGRFTSLTIERWMFIFASKEILDSLNIQTGNQSLLSKCALYLTDCFNDL